jgi:hypothetical protein
MIASAGAVLILVVFGPCRATDGTPAPSRDPGAIMVSRAGSHPSAKGPDERFTGSVRVDLMLQEAPPTRISGGLVTFEPSVRSAWHTHPPARR